MKMNGAVFSKDIENKKLTVIRGFNAQVEKVWRAWTESEILDKWWGPKPYWVETIGRDFREGGFWLYAMMGPDGDTFYSIERYNKIEFQKIIANSCAFCDEKGNDNPDYPSSHWKKTFNKHGDATEVHVEISFNTESDMEAMLKMGFEKGFKAGLDNLDEYLNAE